MPFPEAKLLFRLYINTLCIIFLSLRQIAYNLLEFRYLLIFLTQLIIKQVYFIYIVHISSISN